MGIYDSDPLSNLSGEQIQQLFNRAVQDAIQRGLKENAAFAEAIQAETEAGFGNGREARERATVALALSRSIYVEGRAAGALASSGDISRSYGGCTCVPHQPRFYDGYGGLYVAGTGARRRTRRAQ